MTEYSVSPAGKKFLIPAENEYEAEFKRIEALTKAARDELPHPPEPNGTNLS